MTDEAPLTDDEISAHLDGEAEPGVAARLLADPAAQARSAELDRARALVAAPVDELAPDQVDTLVRSALTAGGEAGGPVEGESGDPRRSRSVPPWLVAAVVVVFMGIGLTLIWSGRQDSSDLEVASSAVATQDKSSPGEGTSDAASDEAGVPTTLGSHAGAAGATESSTDSGTESSLVDLGEFAGPDQLRDALKADFPTGPILDPRRSAEFDQSFGHRCRTQVEAVFSIEADPTAQGAATVDRRPVLVYEFPFSGAGDRGETTLVVAVGAEACDPVLSFQR